ncbi:MAG TPA: tetratricopeptide repeat protein [Polyangia bacterium]|nr:tetratricopeptide repeat protein [Polyangia bacterium]
MPKASTSKHARVPFWTLLLSMALGGRVVAAPVEPAAEPARAQARALMQEGARQMDDRQYDKAVESFSEAYRLVPSPKVLYNLGIAYLSVARYADALQALEGFLKEATDAPAANQATARRHIADLRAKVVTLELKSDRPGAELALDGRSLGAVTFDHPLVIDPGPHDLRARAGEDVVEQAFTAQPGQSMMMTLTFTAAANGAPGATTTGARPLALAPPAPAPPALLVAAPAPPSARPIYRRPWFWAAVGGGAAVAAAIILVLALSRTEYPAVDAKVQGP